MGETEHASHTEIRTLPTLLNHLKNGFGADSRQINFPSDRAFRNAEYRDADDEKERKKYRATIPLPMFDLNVRLIWLSNINFTDPAVISGLPVHFHALVSKGLDPIWIDVDVIHDGRDLFLYVHWLATERNALGGEGYSYDVARAAVDFYVRNVHRLIDIPPRRLSLIAKIIKDNPTPAARDERLEQMLRPADQRPKLILPESWVPVLLWPPGPPQRPDPPPPDPLPTARQPDPIDPALADPTESVPQREPDPQHDPDPPSVASVPETPTSQQDDPAPETPSENHRRGVGDAILDQELPQPEVPPEEQQLPRDPRHTPIKSVDLTDGLDETEDQWELRPMRAGRASPNDRAASRWNRAAVFQLLRLISDDQYVDRAVQKLRSQGHRFWRNVSNTSTLSDIILAAADAPNDPPSGSKANSNGSPENPDSVEPADDNGEIQRPTMTGPATPDADYEMLDDNICLQHFGIPYTAPPDLVPRVLAVRSILEGKVGARDIDAWIKAGYAKSLNNNQALFNISAVRKLVDDAKKQFAAAEADGFKIAEPTEYGANNHGEAHDLMLKALGLQRVVDGLKPLVDGGYLRIIGNVRLYQVEKMRALMEKGRAAQKPPNPVPHDPIDAPR